MEYEWVLRSARMPNNRYWYHAARNIDATGEAAAIFRIHRLEKSYVSSVTWEKKKQIGFQMWGNGQRNSRLKSNW